MGYYPQGEGGNTKVIKGVEGIRSGKVVYVVKVLKAAGMKKSVSALPTAFITLPLLLLHCCISSCVIPPA